MEERNIESLGPKPILPVELEQEIEGYQLFHIGIPKSKGRGSIRSVYKYYKNEKDLSYFTLIKGDAKTTRLELGSIKNPESTIGQIARVIDRSFSTGKKFDRRILAPLLPRNLADAQKLKSALDILTAEGFLNRKEKELKGKLVHEEFTKIKGLRMGSEPFFKRMRSPFSGRTRSVSERVKAAKAKLKKKIPVIEVVFKKIPRTAQVLEVYPIQHPYSKVTIASLPELGGANTYYVEEIELQEKEKETWEKLVDIINSEIEPPAENANSKVHLANEAQRLAEKYGLFKRLDPGSWKRILYYLERELISFGPIHVMMNDPMIEDISVNGIGLPVYIWHRKYESISTNLTFLDENALDNLVIKLTHLAKKHISTAFPILDGMLPGKDRLAATFKREVSPKGGSFTIRRFREEPYSIVDLIDFGTIDESIVAYFWLLIENRKTIAVIGGTGAGKTSTLNALASLVKPSMKVVTVEEIPELNLPHENWVQLVSRESYGLGAMKEGEISLFNLVKTSLRYRPDYIVVGEIRGEEAFVLFQALATGHGGLSTLHAENLDYAIKRLTSPPMNVAKIYIPLVNSAAVVERVQLPKEKSGISFGRRLKTVSEIIDYEDYRSVATWDPVNDCYMTNFIESILLEKIGQAHGLTLKDVLEELERRKAFLRDLKLKGIIKNAEVAKLISNYYLGNPFPPSPDNKAQ